jgi:hypothetical protein
MRVLMERGIIGKSHDCREDDRKRIHGVIIPSPCSRESEGILNLLSRHDNTYIWRKRILGGCDGLHSVKRKFRPCDFLSIIERSY